MKKLFKILGYLVLMGIIIGGAALAGYFFLDTGGEKRNLISFVPPDFVYAIESDRPVKDWQSLSSSEIWNYLKQNDYFADITENADYLDSLLEANQTLVDFVELGDLMISAHMISSQDYENLILVDLKGKGRKLPKLKPVMISLFQKLGYDVSTDSYFNIDLYNLYDPVYKETLTLSAIDNVLMVSYNENLVKKAIDQSEKPSLLENQDFAKVWEKASRDELYTVYMNYGVIDRFIGAYTESMPEMLEGIEEILAFSEFDLSVSDEEIEMNGYVKQVDSVASFLNVFRKSGKGRIKAAQVLPQNTAMYTSIGFDDFSDLYLKFEGFYEKENPEEYATLQKRKRQIEKLLKIDFDRDFFSWMTDEVVTAIVPVDQEAQQYAYYAMLHFNDYDQVKDRLDYVTKRIGKTPVKFEELDYRGYSIKYLKLKGFFSLFFKKMFSEITNPHFTYIDDYVVFSNDTTSLQVMIDTYLEDGVLARKDEYKSFADEFESKSNVFTYMQNRYLYTYLLSMMDYEARKDLQTNRDYLMSFPQVGLQMYPGSDMYQTHLYGEFSPPEPPQ